MRRTLVLVRHAKSSWDDPALVDHDRPLAPRGQKALTRMRGYVAEAGLPPDVVLCSTARRAVDTLEGVRPALPDDVVVEHDRAIFDADAVDLLARLHQLGDEVGRVMVVGHNPTLHDLALTLAGSGDDALRRELGTKLPTGAIVTLTFEGAWRDLAWGAARLDALFTPRPPRP